MAEPINQAAASRLQAATAETPNMAGRGEARDPGSRAANLVDGWSKHGGAEVG